MDCTFGAGGYQRVFEVPDTKVVALDRDNYVIEIANKLRNKFHSRFTFYNENLVN